MDPQFKNQPLLNKLHNKLLFVPLLALLSTLISVLSNRPSVVDPFSNSPLYHESLFKLKAGNQHGKRFEAATSASSTNRGNTNEIYVDVANTPSAEKQNGVEERVKQKELHEAQSIKLRILTHNVYGLPQADCEQRAESFGQKVARSDEKYDIVGLQEYYNAKDADQYTCDAHHLSDAIWSTGRYRNSNNYYRFYPTARWRPNGGVGIFTLHPIIKFDNWRWKNDAQGWPKAPEGFIFARIKIPHADITLDTYVVHLNSGGNNRDRRKKQLTQLATKIAELSRTSQNPVLVMGDFNIGGPPSNLGNAGYEDIMSILKNPKDLWMEANPETDGFTYDCEVNGVARSGDCSGKYRIDYIFVVTNRNLTNSPYIVKPASKDDVKVVQWQVPRVADHRGGDEDPTARDHRSKYVSDHFGLEAVVEITPNPDFNTQVENQNERDGVNTKRQRRNSSNRNNRNVREN